MMNKPHSILIVGPAWVGDMVMAQCLFKLLKQQNPSVKIDVVAPAWSIPLLGRMPEIAQALVMPIGHGELKLAERYELAKSFRTRHYDQAIVLPNSFKSALIPWLAHIPRRTGWRGEMRWFLLNDIRYLDKKRYPLMIEQFMALGLEKNAPLPVSYPQPQLQISSDSQTLALSRHELVLDHRPILALCPGAEFGAAKQWPAEHYAEIANKKASEGWQVWIFGSAKDQVIAEEIIKLTHCPIINLAGKTKLEEAIDLLSLTSGVVSNDSGLMHISAALQKPLIALYGPTSPAFTPPLNADAKILKLNLPCQPCFQRTCPLKHHRCLRDLAPEKILEAMRDWKK